MDFSKLIEQAQNGDSAAFERLVEENYTFVYKVAYKWCQVKEDAEDIAQEVFIKLARKIGTFQEQSTFQTWLYRVTINTAKDLSKKNQRKLVKESAFVTQEEERKSYAKQELSLREKLIAALESLPNKLRETAFLVFGEGLNHKEAAKVLNCAEATVSWRVFQAKRKIKKLMERGENQW